MNILYKLQNYAADHVRWVQYPRIEPRKARHTTSTDTNPKLQGVDAVIALVFAVVSGGVGLLLLAFGLFALYLLVTSF